MSDDLQIQILKIIFFEKNGQHLKACYTQYMICERKLLYDSGRFQCIVIAMRSNFRWL